MSAPTRFPKLHQILTGGIPGKKNPAGLNGGASSPLAGASSNGSDMNINVLATPRKGGARNSLDQLDAWIEQGAREAFTVRATLTPEMARRLLGLNPDNRTISTKSGGRRSVSSYADAITRGEWMLNGSTIVVSRCGYLNDGQHRCHAVIAADRAIETMIAFGVARESRMTLDLGRARSPGDFLKMRGEINVNSLAHALQFLFAYERNRTFNISPSTQQLEETLESHPEIREALKEIGTLARAYQLSNGYLAGAYYVCVATNPGIAAHFLRTATTGLGIADQRSPVYRLRKRFQDHLTAKNSRIDATEQAALFIKAFNAYGQRDFGQLRWRRRGDAAEDFPRAGA